MQGMGMKSGFLHAKRTMKLKMYIQILASQPEIKILKGIYNFTKDEIKFLSQCLFSFISLASMNRIILQTEFIGGDYYEIKQS